MHRFDPIVDGVDDIVPTYVIKFSPSSPGVSLSLGLVGLGWQWCLPCSPVCCCYACFAAAATRQRRRSPAPAPHTLRRPLPPTAVRQGRVLRLAAWLRQAS